MLIFLSIAGAWYNQQVDACKDHELRAILAHNCDEEKEHAAMVLEWIRQKVPAIDNEPKDYLFTEKSIAHIDRYSINSTETVDLNIYFLTK